VWNGTFGPSDRAAVAFWDAMLQRRGRIAANDGSDLHGHETDGRAQGTPTTVVHADALSREALVAALRAGRSFITRHPAGVEVYLDASTRDGRVASVGGAVHPRSDELVQVTTHLRRATGTVLHLHGGGQLWHCARITRDVATVTTRVPAAAGFVRAEVLRPPGSSRSGALAKSTSTGAVTQPFMGRSVTPATMEALTNAIAFASGPPPDAPPFWAPWPADS
jgi:hypothetical protein